MLPVFSFLLRFFFLFLYVLPHDHIWTLQGTHAKKNWNKFKKKKKKKMMDARLDFIEIHGVEFYWSAWLRWSLGQERQGKRGALQSITIIEPPRMTCRRVTCIAGEERGSSRLPHNEFGVCRGRLAMQKTIYCNNVAAGNTTQD